MSEASAVVRVKRSRLANGSAQVSDGSDGLLSRALCSPSLTVSREAVYRQQDVSVAGLGVWGDGGQGRGVKQG